MSDKKEENQTENVKASPLQCEVMKPTIDDHEIKEVSEEFLSTFLQSWGQDSETKIKALNRALVAAGIEATFVQEEKEGETIGGYECEEEAAGHRAADLRKRLTKGWMLGNYQAEAARVERIIREFRNAS